MRSAKMTYHLLAAVAFVSAEHYGSAPCLSDEKLVTISGPDSPVICAAECGPRGTADRCPTDLPKNTTAKATCALQESDGTKYCGLICGSRVGEVCPTGSACNIPPTAIVGYCGYPTTMVSLLD